MFFFLLFTCFYSDSTLPLLCLSACWSQAVYKHKHTVPTVSFLFHPGLNFTFSWQTAARLNIVKRGIQAWPLSLSVCLTVCQSFSTVWMFSLQTPESFFLLFLSRPSQNTTYFILHRIASQRYGSSSTTSKIPSTFLRMRLYFLPDFPSPCLTLKVFSPFDTVSVFPPRFAIVPPFFQRRLSDPYVFTRGPRKGSFVVIKEKTGIMRHHIKAPLSAWRSDTENTSVQKSRVWLNLIWCVWALGLL